MKRFLLITVFVILTLMLSVIAQQAGQLYLLWAVHSDLDVAGYKVFQETLNQTNSNGEIYSYIQIYDVPGQKNNHWLIPLNTPKDTSFEVAPYYTNNVFTNTVSITSNIVMFPTLPKNPKFIKN